MSSITTSSPLWLWGTFEDLDSPFLRHILSTLISHRCFTSSLNLANDNNNNQNDEDNNDDEDDDDDDDIWLSMRKL
jgi:uncharacterized protein YqhQ